MNTAVGTDGDRRGFYLLEILGHDLEVADLAVLRGARIRPRIGRAHTVDTRMGALYQDLWLDLGGPQRGGSVGGEERVAGTGGEDHDASLLQMAYGATTD